MSLGTRSRLLLLRAALPGAGALLLAFAAAPGEAAKKPAVVAWFGAMSASTDVSGVVKVTGVGKAPSHVGLTFRFGAGTFTLDDDSGNTAAGTFTQSGSGGRKLLLTFDEPSKGVIATALLETLNDEAKPSQKKPSTMRITAATCSISADRKLAGFGLRTTFTLEASGGDLTKPAKGKCTLGGRGTLAPTQEAADIVAGAGGTVALLDGASVVFAPGALSGNARMSIARVALPAPLPADVLSNGAAYDLSLETSGVSFDEATLRLPLPTSGGTATILRFMPETGQWADVGGAAVAGGFVEQKVKHFSIGVPVSLRATDPMPPAPPRLPPPPRVGRPIDAPRIDMVDVAGGTLYMGSDEVFGAEKPIHPVNLSSFQIGRYEVTNAQFALFLKDVGNQTEDGESWYDMLSPDAGIETDPSDTQRPFRAKAGRENLPVAGVSESGAMEFCNWLSVKGGLQPCHGGKGARGVVDVSKKGYRLPTEAEWEFVATDGRGQPQTFAWGTAPLDPASPQENVGRLRTGLVAVGSYPAANRWGVFDMGGNVTEICADYFDYGYYATLTGTVTNPVGPASSPVDGRTMRGANYFTESSYGGFYFSVAMRNYTALGASGPTVGLRVARTK
jgi:formylglycine-generating enzyme required for sulfatase activity